jgi:hypothetical protein
MLLPCHTLLQSTADTASTTARSNTFAAGTRDCYGIHPPTNSAGKAQGTTLPNPPGVHESEGSRHYQRREEYQASVETPGHHVARVTPGASSRSSPLSTARFLSTLSPLGTARDHHYYQASRLSDANDDAASDTDSSVMSMYDSFCADLTGKLGSHGGDLSVDPL